MSQYFGSDTNHTEKVRQMVRRVDHFDTIVVGSEFEALVLECSLIKQYNPKYNILLKDDKGYHYVRISPPPYSRISEAKLKQDDGARYLGPYLSTYVVRETVDEANRVFQLSTCSRPLAYGKPGASLSEPLYRPVLRPCTGRVREEDYAERVGQAVELLTQGSSRMAALLTERMEAAAENLEFEKAARYRDRVNAIRKIGQKQKVVMSRIEEQDVIAAAQGPEGVCFAVLRFTGGSLSDKEDFIIEEADALPSVRSEFLRRYYAIRERVPYQVTIDGEVEDRELLEDWLTEKAGGRRRVRIVLPQKGSRRS